MSASTVVEVPVYLSPAEVCVMVPGMTERSLREMRAYRVAGAKGPKAGPRFSKPNAKTIVYAAVDVQRYVDSLKVGAA